jgi:hypothetical protein
MLGESEEVIRFQKAKQVVEDFLQAVFSECDRSVGERPWWEIELEDVYSVLDRALSEDDVLLRGSRRRDAGGCGLERTLSEDEPYDHERLYLVRNSLDTCIAYAISHATPADLSLYDAVYNELCARYDDWATISTNWDLLWDNTLQQCSSRCGQTVDYGVPARAMEDGSLLPRGGPLLYKLHGSLNWGSCPCCHGMFARTDGRLWVPQIMPAPCPRCGSNEETPSLRTFIITPTALKTIRNPIVQMVYDEAFALLRRATTVIFVGYSLPAADHNLRYLFRRGISTEASVKVILRDPGATDVFRRYQSLLGLPNDSLCTEGFESFFNLRGRCDRGSWNLS